MDLDINMNSNILVSILNMKLRNDFSDLDDLCTFYDVNRMDLAEKLDQANYFYSEEKRQFLIK